MVLCNASNFYFDLAYQKDPQEVGADWAGFVDTEAAWRLPPLDLYLAATHDLMGNPLSPDDYRNAVRLTAEGIGNVLGIQGELWSENQKTDAIMEYMALPKMIGLAERAWAQPSNWTTEQDPDKRDVLQAAEWARFANAVGQHELPRLDDLQGGYAYRIPPPGAIIEDGQLKANVAFPGMKIRYTLDGTEPDARKNEHVVALPDQVSPTLIVHVIERAARGYQRSASAPFEGILRGTLGLRGWVRKRQDDGLVHVLRHLFDHLFGEGARPAGRADQHRWLECADHLDRVCVGALCEPAVLQCLLTQGELTFEGLVQLPSLMKQARRIECSDGAPELVIGRSRLAHGR